jgi:hypothetical protein
VLQQQRLIALDRAGELDQTAVLGCKNARQFHRRHIPWRNKLRKVSKLLA